jgi:hypothetical protein
MGPFRRNCRIDKNTEFIPNVTAAKLGSMETAGLFREALCSRHFFGGDNGLKSDIEPCPKSATTRIMHPQ